MKGQNAKEKTEMGVRGRRRKESGGKKDTVGWNMFEKNKRMHEDHVCGRECRIDKKNIALLKVLSSKMYLVKIRLIR